MFCPQCGSKLADGAKFCPSCGAPVAAAAPPAATPPAQASVPTPPPAQPRRSKAPLVIGGVAVLVVAALVALAVLVLPHLMGGSSWERLANNDCLNYMAGTATDGEKIYFYSTKAGGICSSPKDGSSAQLIYPIDANTSYVAGFAVDGGRIYFCVSDYMGDDTRNREVHSIKTDGTDDKILLTEPVEQEDQYSSLDQLLVYDNTIYMATFYGGASSGGDKGHVTISTMGVDGSNWQERCRINDNLISGSLLMGHDTIYYADGTSISSVSLDGEDYRSIYVTQGEWIRSLAVEDGRLFFNEGGGGTASIATVAVDGTDHQTIYTFPGRSSGSLRAVHDGTVYFESYTLDYDQVDVGTWDLMSVPATGGEAKTVLEDVGLYNPSLMDLGFGLMGLENGQYQGSVGAAAMLVGYDGSGVTMIPLG